MDFIKNRFYFYFLSFSIVMFGALSFYIFSPSFGIDLTGGQILEVKTKANVYEIINKLSLKALIYPQKDGFLLKSSQDLSLAWQEILKEDPSSKKIRFESISGNLSSELRKRSLWMIIIILFAIGFYVALAFYKLKREFSLFVLGFVVIVTLLHDVLATTGFYVLISKFLGFDLDIKFITALLIIVGFSVHDTIVVFDRLRENILISGKKDKQIFNDSINQTIRRSVFTSLTAVLSVFPLTFLISDLKAFLLSIQIGIIIGTYSSIFLASPLLFDLKEDK
jgi:preprotein translocase subunit SecF